MVNLLACSAEFAILRSVAESVYYGGKNKENW